MERVEINALPPIMLNEVAAYGGTILGYNEATNSTVVEIDDATKLDVLKTKYPDLEIITSTDPGDAGFEEAIADDEVPTEEPADPPPEDPPV